MTDISGSSVPYVVLHGEGQIVLVLVGHGWQIDWHTWQIHALSAAQQAAVFHFAIEIILAWNALAHEHTDERRSASNEPTSLTIREINPSSM